MKINSADNVESVVAHGITDVSDMRQDTLQMPDDLTDEDEGKTKDDEKILCNLIDDYVTRTILSIRDERIHLTLHFLARVYPLPMKRQMK
jgi:hypothetical protein